MARSGIVLFLIISLWQFGCGRKTPPRPIISAPSFSEVKAIQKDEQIRLSWKMRTTKVNNQFFHIEELALDPYCVACELEPTKTYLLPFPSDHFIVEGKTVFFRPAVQKNLKVYVFRVTLQDQEGGLLGKTQATQFTGFVDFPEPQALQWKWLPQGSFPDLKNLPIPENVTDIKEGRFIRFSWEAQVEANVMNFPKQENATEQKVYYRVNLYKTEPGKPWPELPLNQQPISGSFYIDYQKQTEHTWQYQFRLVDSKGNESLPSSIYKTQI